MEIYYYNIDMKGRKWVLNLFIGSVGNVVVPVRLHFSLGREAPFFHSRVDLLWSAAGEEFNSNLVGQLPRVANFEAAKLVNW